MGTRSSRFPFHRFSPACAFPNTSLQKLCAQRRLDCCLQTKFTLKCRHMPPAYPAQACIHLSAQVFIHLALCALPCTCPRMRYTHCVCPAFPAQASWAYLPLHHVLHTVHDAVHTMCTPCTPAANAASCVLQMRAPPFVYFLSMLVPACSFCADTQAT